jgi:hypothetical protein
MVTNDSGSDGAKETSYIKLIVPVGVREAPRPLLFGRGSVIERLEDKAI